MDDEGTAVSVCIYCSLALFDVAHVAPAASRLRRVDHASAHGTHGPTTPSARLSGVSARRGPAQLVGCG